jgi:DNA primase
MIPEATVTAIKERTDLVALIGETVKLIRRGRSFVGLCPFHKEKTPSFHVNPERGVFRCFGCAEHGGAVDFLMQTEGYTFVEAIKVLAERLNIVIEETAGSKAPKQDKEDLYAVNASAAVFFEHSLGHHPLACYAREELERRALNISDTPRAFRLGYAPAGWDALATYFQQQGVPPGAAERVGLLVPRPNGPGYYDRFRHRLMFPVVDHLGRVVAFSGRALPELTAEEMARLKLKPAKDPPAKYINSPESPIYTKGEHLYGLWQAKSAIRESGEAVLVEGNFDVVSMHAHRFTNAVAPLGTAFTANQAKLLKRFTHNVTIFFDGDAAGRKATREARKPCLEAHLDAKVAKLPQGADPDSQLRERGEDDVGGKLLKAKGMLETVLDDLLDHGTFAAASLEEQGKRVREATAFLAECKDEVGSLVTGYANKLATALVVAGVLPETMRELLANTTKTIVPKKPGDADWPQREMLGALLDYPSLLKDQAVLEATGTMSGDWAYAVSVLAGGDRVEQYPQTLQDFVVGRTIVPMFENEAHAKRVFLDNADLLSRMADESVGSLDVEVERWRVKASGDE